MLILHLTLLLMLAVIPSQSDNKTATQGSGSGTASQALTTKPITITTIKNAKDGSIAGDDSRTGKLKQEFGKQRLFPGDTTSISKRQDPSFSSSLIRFDDPSDIISPDIDDIDVKSDPSFDIDTTNIQGSASFNINNPKFKDTSTFDIDTSSFTLGGASFNIDGGTFHLDSPSFDIGTTPVKSSPTFGIDTLDFDLDEPIAKASSFQSEFHNGKRSPSYNSEPISKNNLAYNLDSLNSKNIPDESKPYKSDVPKPETSRGKATSGNPTYDSFSKQNYNYPKSNLQGFTTPYSTYLKPIFSSTSPGPAYGDNKVQYVSNQVTPKNRVFNSYGTTSYENYIVPTSSASPTDQSRTIPNIKTAYLHPSEASAAQKLQAFTPGQTSFKNNLFSGQGTFTGEYPQFQTLSHNSYPQNGANGALQYSISQSPQNPIYNSQYPGSKNSQQVYAPGHQTVVTFAPTSQSFDKLSQNLAYTNSPLEYRKRATASPTVQIQNIQDFPGFIQAIETEPVVLNTGGKANYHSAPNFGLSYDFGKGGVNKPFLATADKYQQQQILPVQSASSTPQFPQYKGASINAYSKSDFGKEPGTYQPLINQPQLHFNAAGQLITKPQVIASPKSSEGIKEDVEIIKRKKTPPPPQKDDEGEEEEEEKDDDGDDDEELDEGYKAIEREYGQPDEDDDEEDDGESSESRPNAKETGSSENYSGEEQEFKSSMPPMPAFVFKPYDEKVGRLHEFVRQPELQNRFSEEAEDDEEYAIKTYSPAKTSSAEYDEKSTKPYFSFTNQKSAAAYDANENDGGEISKYEKQEDEGDTKEYPHKGLKALRDYDLRYQKKYDKPYKIGNLENRYSFGKQVPDSSPSVVESKVTHPKISKYSKGKNYTPKSVPYSSYDNGPSTERSIRTETKKPIKQTYRAAEEEEAAVNFKTQPRVIHQESFGYKAPKKGEKKEKFSNTRKVPTEVSSSRYAADNDDVERYSEIKKIPIDDSYVHASRDSHKSNSPKKGNASYENGDSYSISSVNNWKSNKKTPESTESNIRPYQETKHVAYITEDDFNFFSPERIRPGLSGSIFRDFIDVY